MNLDESRDERRLLYLLLARIECLRPHERLELARVCGDSSSLRSLSQRDVEWIIGRRIRRARWEPLRSQNDAERDFSDLTRGHIGCIFFHDEGYPPQLREIFDPPAVLFFRGNPLDSFPTGVAVVGTRYPTGRARNAAFDLGWELSVRMLSVVSGLARGIDSEVHHGALKGPGYLVGVLGSSLDLLYPRSSEGLGHDILRSGGILFSEYPPGTPPRKYHFPARNRIISGLARSTVVVQAPVSSGALITADYALEQGRDLYLHAAGLDGRTGAGGRNLVREGAPVVKGAHDVLLDWGVDESEAELPMAKVPSEPARAGKRLARLLELEMSGRLAHHNGRYACCLQTEGPVPNGSDDGRAD